MTAQIAQLVVPSDGLGSPTGAIVDWPRSKIYLWRSNASSIRSYDVSLTTQSPILSAALPLETWAADADPVTGNLVLQTNTAAANGSPIALYDAATLTQLASFGISTAFPAYPTSVWAGQALVGVECNGVGYALVKESELSGHVAAIRTDTMAHAGFYAAVVSGCTLNRAIMCRGASGAAGGSAFLTWEGAINGQSATIPLYKVTIAPGAETYNPATWPTANTHITSATIGTIAAASIDAAWATLQANSIGYDSTDGNVLLDVTGAGGGSARYIAKVNAATAAVIWKTPLGASGAALPGYHVGRSRAGFLPSGAFDTVNTSTGALATEALSGLGSISSVMSDDTSGLILLRCAYTAGTGAPVAVSGTPSSFTSFALIGGLLIPPDFPLTGVVKVLLPPAELQFCDAIGAPYAGGTLEFYEQNTTTPKDTWNSPLGGDAHLNTNPLTLDSAGRALIYGDGAYRTVLRDALGNLVWDQPSFTYVSACMVPVVGAADLATARQAMGITDAIEAEALARAAADSAEATARASADAALQAALDAEIARAEAAEAALGALIAGLPPPASPGNVQGGSASLDASGHCHITFPTPFATACDSFVVTGLAVGVWSGAFNVANQTTTGIDVWGSIFGSRTPASGVVFFWLATGH